MLSTYVGKNVQQGSQTASVAKMATLNKTGLSNINKIMIRLLTSYLIMSSLLSCVNFHLQLFSFIVFSLICIDYCKI